LGVFILRIVKGSYPLTHQQMPCACLLPPEIYPDASEWGPILWSILHGLAEKSGHVVTPMFEGDERRALAQLFKALSKTIPCPSCKDHYDSYLKENPVDTPLKELPYQELNEYVRRWFWELHNWVNESYGKPTFPFEDLSAAYKHTNVRAALKTLDVPMKRAIRLRSNQFFGYNDFVKWSITLLSLYGS
jgi:hypothetical protein